MAKKDDREARVILAEYLAADQRTVSWLARLLEVSPSTAARWVNGTTRPREAQRRQLQELYKIHPDAWSRV